MQTNTYIHIYSYTGLGSNALLVTSLPLPLLIFGNDRYFFLSVTVTVTSLHFYSNDNEFNRYFYRYFSYSKNEQYPMRALLSDVMPRKTELSLNIAHRVQCAREPLSCLFCYLLSVLTFYIVHWVHLIC